MRPPPGPQRRSNRPRPAWLPGDLTPEQRIGRILRVDLAGEYGAVRIYEGQLAVLRHNRAAARVIREMAVKEREHLEEFKRRVGEGRVRPSLLQPIWHVAGFALGAGTALLGTEAAMACTEAVEAVIDEHYAEQVGQLAAIDPELAALCDRYRADEVEHGETAVAHGARQAPAYRPLSAVVKAGSRAAIWLAERF